MHFMMYLIIRSLLVTLLFLQTAIVRPCTFVSTCFCNFGVEVSIHLTRVIGSWHHYFTIVALLPKTVQFGFARCIEHT